MDRETTEEIRRNFTVVAEGLRTDIRTVVEGLVATNERLDRTVEEVKRHFNVVTEGLRSEIRTVAEGFVATNETLDRFEVRVFDRFGEMESLMRLSFGDLDRRIQGLASR